METVDVEAIHRVREQLRTELAEALAVELQQAYQTYLTREPATDGSAMGRRALANVCLSYLACLEGAEQQLEQHFRQAGNMTDRMNALALIASGDFAIRPPLLQAFHDTWKEDDLVLNKWFQVQALSHRNDTPEQVRELMSHPAFSLRNPNRVRALIGAFSQGNQLQFHVADGRGYALLAEVVLALNASNPQIAARICLPLTRWRRQDAARQSLMRAELERIVNAPKLSKDVYEVVSKGLQA